MSDSERDREEPKAFVYHGGQGDPHQAEDAAAATTRCPDCRGRGSVLLLITTRPCARCGGTGVVRPAPAEPVAEPTCYVLPADPAPPEAELPPVIYSYYVRENDLPVSEDRLLFEAGQWWNERYVVTDGPWRLVSRTPAPPPRGWAKGSAE
ncbi:MAG TPA: hypothetical protein VGI81_00995 [Tepidisphaeraceae bacterium]|jgi:hypothetical protein